MFIDRKKKNQYTSKDAFNKQARGTNCTLMFSHCQPGASLSNKVISQRCLSFVFIDLLCSSVFLYMLEKDMWTWITCARDV